MSQDPAFTEPFYVEDKVVAALAYTDEIAPNLFRCAFYSEQRSLCGTRGEKERTVVSKFIMTADQMRALALALDNAANKGRADLAEMPAAATAFN